MQVQELVRGGFARLARGSANGWFLGGRVEKERGDGKQKEEDGKYGGTDMVLKN